MHNDSGEAATGLAPKPNSTDLAAKSAGKGRFVQASMPTAATCLVRGAVPIDLTSLGAALHTGPDQKAAEPEHTVQRGRPADPFVAGTDRQGGDGEAKRSQPTADGLDQAASGLDHVPGRGPAAQGTLVAR